MWEQESEKYWKKRNKHRVNWMVAAAIIAAVILLGCGVAFMTFRDRESKEAEAAPKARQPVVLSDEPIRLTFPKIPSKSCLDQAADDDKWAIKLCGESCRKVKNVPPRPATHRSCMEGCHGGALKGLIAGCSATTKDDCIDATRDECSRVCESYRSPSSNPGLYDKCIQNCHQTANIVCDRSMARAITADEF